MRFFNIDKGLELPQKYNILHDALDELYARRQEEFQKSNPLKEIYQVYPLNQFQKSFGSSTGFQKAFEKTVDYAAYPGFTNGDGFRATVSYVPVNGKVVFTWQMILEGDASGIKETLSDYQIAWQRQIVQLGMFALTAMFGQKVTDPVSKIVMKINSADTVDGDPLTEVKNPVFTNKHTIVRREDTPADYIEKNLQTNKYYIDIKLDGSDPLAYAKLADALYQIKVRMSKLKDDNNQLAGVSGVKKLVCTEDAHLNQAIDSILAADNWSCATGGNKLNPVKGAFKTYYTPYLDGNDEQPIPQFAVDDAVGHAHGILMLDDSYNKANHGPMMIERVGFSMKAVKTEEPEGIKYLAKQAFNFACPAWRGIAYIYIGKPLTAEQFAELSDDEKKANEWKRIETFTPIVPVAFAKPVSVVGTVTTKTEA